MVLLTDFKCWCGEGESNPKGRSPADFESLSKKNQVLHFLVSTMT